MSSSRVKLGGFGSGQAWNWLAAAPFHCITTPAWPARLSGAIAKSGQPTMRWRRLATLQRASERTTAACPPPRKSSAWVPLQAVQQARWRGHLLGPPMPHGGVAAGETPAKPKQPNGDTRHLPLSELASDDLKFAHVGSAPCFPNSLRSPAGIVPFGMDFQVHAPPSPPHWPAAFRSQERPHWISVPGLRHLTSCLTPGRDRLGLI